MTPNLAFELLTFGAILTAASVGLFNIYPETGKITLMVLAVGGSLCLCLGVQGLMGRGGVALARFTTAGLAIFAAGRSIIAWRNLASGEIPFMEPIICSAMLLFSMGLTFFTWKEDK